MPSPGVGPAEYQVHYLGSSADLAAVRRSLEARGVVSRARLTPTVTAVVADPSVPLDHPTRLAAQELGIDVLAPAEAMDLLLAGPGPAHAQRPAPLPVANTPMIAVAVLLMIGLLALLGYFGALTGADSQDQLTQDTAVERVIDDQR